MVPKRADEHAKRADELARQADDAQKQADDERAAKEAALARVAQLEAMLAKASNP